jgi:hypothetical protein
MNPMRHEGTGELFAYWDKLRGTRAAPERREIAPTSVGSRLADTFILQAVGACEPRFRIAGTRICSVYGRELTGLSFSSLWQTKDRSNISRLVKNCMTSKAVTQVNYEGISTRERRALFELILLPLASEANERHLMGMIIALGRPFWLESDAIVENRIQSVSVIGPHHPTRPLGGEPAKLAPEGVIMTPPPFVQRIISRRVGHLRVVDGGKISD